MRLWGAVRDMRGPVQPRPGFLVQQMCNGMLGGDLLTSKQEGRLNSNPDLDLTNGSRFSTFYSRSNGRFHFAVFNLTHKDVPVKLSGVGAATDIRKETLVFTELSDNNEDDIKVRRESASVAAFGDGPMTIGSNSFTVWSWARD